MRLVGMMDSPYVRRVAITMRLLGLAHDHDQVSVFRHMDRFRAINPSSRRRRSCSTTGR